MRSVFVLTYGWRDDDKPLRATFDSIDSAEKEGENFLAAERRFIVLNAPASSEAYYRIERFNFDVVIAERNI